MSGIMVARRGSIAASGGASGPAVYFDAMGEGSAPPERAASLSWTHTATAGATVFVDVSFNFLVVSTLSATYGGVPMTSLGVSQAPASQISGVWRFVAFDVPSGPQAVVVTSGLQAYLVGNSISLTGVVYVPPAYAPTGDGVPTHSVTCVEGEMILQSFGKWGTALGALAGGTERYLAQNGTANTVSIGMQTSSTSTTFSAGSGTDDWAAIYNVLSPLPEPPLLAFDDFNRANSGTIGSNWTEFAEYGNGLIINTDRLGTQAQTFSGSGGGIRWGTPCTTDDMFSEITYLAGSPSGLDPFVREDGNDNSVRGRVLPGGAWSIRALGDTVRASGSSASLTSGAVIRIEAVGNVYTLKVNGSAVGSWTDSGGLLTPGPTRRRVGLRLNVSQNNGSVWMDDWSGGDL